MVFGAVTHGSSNKKITRRQLLANRRNARLAGVRTPEGKAVSRHNARKHGIFASALTPLDRRELSPILEDFMEQTRPTGVLERTVAEKMAVTYLRMQRCARAEAQFHQATWAPDVRYVAKGPLNRDSFFKPWHFDRIVNVINRYDVSLTNQFVRLLHELERLQRMRGGEKLPAPVAADVGVAGG